MESVSQYDIWLVNLDPTVGSEMKKIRPCVVVSPNEMNQFLRTIVIAPVTSSSKLYPTRTEINQTNVKGWIVLDQVRTVDKSRLIKKVATLSTRDIKVVKDIIREIFVD